MDISSCSEVFAVHRETPYLLKKEGAFPQMFRVDLDDTTIFINKFLLAVSQGNENYTLKFDGIKDANNEFKKPLSIESVTLGTPQSWPENSRNYEKKLKRMKALMGEVYRKIHPSTDQGKNLKKLLVIIQVMLDNITCKVEIEKLKAKEKAKSELKK